MVTPTSQISTSRIFSSSGRHLFDAPLLKLKSHPIRQFYPQHTQQANLARCKYFLYLRTANQSTAQPSGAIERQKRELLKLYGHLTIVEIITEVGSAATPGGSSRPLFSKMMERIEAGEANGIIAMHPDRLARNCVDAGRIMRNLNQGKLIDLKFLR